MYCPYTQETSFKCSIARGGRNGKRKDGMDIYMYIICLLLNKRTMNDFKRLILYSLILEKLDLQV